MEPGEKRHLRYEISETYLGDPGEICGTLVVVHFVNVPAYQAQQRYIPIYDQDLNRWFPGRPDGNTTARMAHEVFERFVAPCDRCLDVDTSTRNRMTMYHARADVSNPAVEELARAFSANLVIGGTGESGSLRAAATAAGTPTVTVEMGKAHRFQPVLVEKVLAGVESVLAQYGVLPDVAVSWPGWFRVGGGESEKSWLRADSGGLVDMLWGPYPLVRKGETICTITAHVGSEERIVEAPFTGLLVGVLKNPLALPGHPLCHLARIDEATREENEVEIETGEFDGYRANGTVWRAGDGGED